MGRAAAAGLLGVHRRPADVFAGDPSESELFDLRELRAATQQVIHESVDPGRLQSALTHWELWRTEAPARVPFLPLRGPDSPGADAAASYNAETFELFTASCLRRGSLRPGHIGSPLEPDTVSGYVSALRSLLSRDGGVQMRSAQHDTRITALRGGVRRARGPRPSRRRRRGLRARQLRAAAANRSFDRKQSWASRRRWAAAVVGHSLIARGGELGRVSGKLFSAQRGLTWANVSWHEVGTLHATHAAATIHLHNVKDPEGLRPRVPIPIRRHAKGGAAADDPLCAYDLLLAAWRDDVRVLGTAAALQSPIFRHSAKGGVEDAISTTDVCRIVRDVAAAAGEDPADFGGHSLRVGGASDFRDLFDCSTAGLEEAERVLKKRGRWRSDIAFIYTRASLATALEASARLAQVDGGDIEAAFSAWAEPAI